MASSLQDIMASLNGQYDPQAQLVQKQMDGLAGQETAAIAGADAAKNNAFAQNQNNANNMNMLYSGQGLENNNRYIGSTYAPAIAGIKQNTQQQGFQLQNALLGIRKQQSDQAYGMYNDQVNREQQQRQYEQQRADSIAQFNRQLAAQQASVAAQKAASQPSQTQVLSSAFNNYNANLADSKKNGDAFYTEHQIAPYIQAQLGVDYNTAKNLAYQYRKQVYGN